MNQTEWILLLVVVGILVGPFLAIKALASFRKRGRLPPAQPYKDDPED